MKPLGYVWSSGTVLCARHTTDQTDPGNESGRAGAIFRTDEAHSDVVCDVAGYGVILARNCCDGCGTGEYTHFLYYDDRGEARQAQACIMATFENAELYAASSSGYAHAFAFVTTSEFSEEQARKLVQVLSPDDYDLNNEQGDDE